MRNDIKFFGNLHTHALAFWDLDSYDNTASAVQLNDETLHGQWAIQTRQWVKCCYEYTRSVTVVHNGERVCLADALTKHILTRWPTYRDFEVYAVTRLNDERKKRLGSVDGPIYRDRSGCPVDVESKRLLTRLDICVLKHWTDIPASDRRLRYRYTIKGRQPALLRRPGIFFCHDGENTPPICDAWKLRYQGVSFAEYVLNSGDSLPYDFEYWGLSVGTAPFRRTVAHLAAEFDKLPHWFRRWRLRDGIHNRTVAHTLIYHHGFDARKYLDLQDSVWLAKDDCGITVAEYEQRQRLMKAVEPSSVGAAQALLSLPSGVRRISISIPEDDYASYLEWATALARTKAG